ncbi:MAG: molybdopterin-dependent oxidoreductase [Arenicellales bacterium]
MSQYKPSVCPHDCPSACALEVECLDDATIGKVRGAKANNYTQGVLCTKVANYAERVHHPDRLTVPLMRTGPKGSGEYTPISWDAAMTRVAEEFQKATDEHGAESVWPYYYAGTMGAVQRDGILRLKNAFGYSGMDKTICTINAYAGWKAGAGNVRGADSRDIIKSDLIVIWGCNAVATQINFMKHVAQAKRDRNTTVVVVDPSTTGTAKKADIHLALKPGTDGALAAAMMHCLFRDGLADWEYLNKMTDDPQGLEASLKDKNPEWAADITGLSIEAIESFAALYGNTQRSFIRLGIGFSRSRNGAPNVHAVSCLPVITGAWQHPGGGALLGMSGIFKLNTASIEGTDLSESTARVLDMSRVGAVLLGEAVALKNGPPVKAMLIQNTNPMAVAPDLNKVYEGFAREDLFVCVHEQFMTETAKMADIILPATMFVEHDDIYTSYGQTHLQVSQPIISPLAECRSNHEVICDLAKRLGSEEASFSVSAKDLIKDALAASEGYPNYEALIKNKWFDCSVDVDMQFKHGFDWPDKKFRLKPVWSDVGDDFEGMPEWPGHWAVTETATAEKPYRLTTPPARRFLNSSFTQSPSSLKTEIRPALRIHPNDANAENIQTDQLIEIGNDLGVVTLHAKITDTTLEGVLEVRGVWPGDAFEGGVGINALISAKPAQPCGGATFHDAAVWLKHA